MNNNVKNFAIAALATGVALIFGGAWLNVTWVIAGGGLLLIGLLLVLHLVINRKLPQKDVVTIKPISTAEYQRGRKDLINWLQGFNDGYGDKLMHLDFKEKRAPNEVIRGVIEDTDQGKADLESYVLRHREDWREYYSDEEWKKGKSQILAELNKCKPEAMDKPFVSVGTEQFTLRELIKEIINEGPTGQLHIIMTLRWNKEKLTLSV